MFGSGPSVARKMHARARGSRWRLARALALTYAFGLVSLSAAQAVTSRRDGVLVLAAIFAPYLFLPCFAMLPLLVRGTPLQRGSVLCCILLAAQFAPHLAVAPPPVLPTATTLTVLTWNVASYQRDRRAIRQFIESSPADIVALEEDYSSWWDENPEMWQRQEATLARIYPYQIRYLHGAPQGLTILSRYPILARSQVDVGGDEASPAIAWGRLDLGQGQTVIVAAAHVANPLRTGVCSWRLCFDPRRRDSDIAAVRSTIDPVLQRGEPLVLLGDFNLTDREPAYRDLTAGLWDAYRTVGGGMGHTWGAVSPLGLPLLRIDYVLGNAAITPLDLQIDCTPRGSDHCGLRSRLSIP